MMDIRTARQPRSHSTRKPRSGHRFPFFLPFLTNVPFPTDNACYEANGYVLYRNFSHYSIETQASEDTTEVPKAPEVCCRDPSNELRTFHRRKKKRMPEPDFHGESRKNSFLDVLDCDVPISSWSCEKTHVVHSQKHSVNRNKHRDLFLFSDSYDDYFNGEISQAYNADTKRSVKRKFTTDQQVKVRYKQKSLVKRQNKFVAISNKKSLSAKPEGRDAHFLQEKNFTLTGCSLGWNPSMPKEMQQADTSACIAKKFTKTRKTMDLFGGDVKSSDLSLSDKSQPHTVRKSTRVPKKRSFDDDTGGTSNVRKMVESKRESIFENSSLKMEDTNDASRSDNSVKSDSVEREPHVSPEQCSTEFNKDSCHPEQTGFTLPDVSLPCLLQKSKEGISHSELAIKKEEAAKRRKQELENNAKRTQANAIQKILGQESSRKKREEKFLKQRQEMEQEKQAALLAPPVNSIRWTMGPSGNIVSFSEDVELSRIFPGPRSYPQEREKCAGPFCNNAYKYRDSKTQLPLCSLQCYKAVQKIPNLTPAF